MLGRFDEAEAFAWRSRELGGDNVSIRRQFWPRVQALVLAHRGGHAEAERLAREAVEAFERGDSLTFQGDAWCDL